MCHLSKFFVFYLSKSKRIWTLNTSPSFLCPNFVNKYIWVSFETSPSLFGAMTLIQHFFCRLNWNSYRLDKATSHMSIISESYHCFCFSALWKLCGEYQFSERELLLVWELTGGTAGKITIPAANILFHHIYCSIKPVGNHETSRGPKLILLDIISFTNINSVSAGGDWTSWSPLGPYHWSSGAASRALVGRQFRRGGPSLRWWSAFGWDRYAAGGGAGEFPGPSCEFLGRLWRVVGEVSSGGCTPHHSTTGYLQFSLDPVCHNDFPQSGLDCRLEPVPHTRPTPHKQWDETHSNNPPVRENTHDDGGGCPALPAHLPAGCGQQPGDIQPASPAWATPTPSLPHPAHLRPLPQDPRPIPRAARWAARPTPAPLPPLPSSLLTVSRPALPLPRLSAPPPLSSKLQEREGGGWR